MESWYRVCILGLLRKKKTMSIVEIARKIELSEKTTKHHLNHLKRNRVISFKKIKKKRGSPIMVSLRPEKNTVSLAMIDRGQYFLKLMKEMKDFNISIFK